MGKTAEQLGLKKSAITQRLILDAAAKVFRESAYSDVRLADIAAAAGMQTGSLYYHFASREDLVDQVLVAGVNRVFSETVARVEALPSDAGPREKLACAIRAHLETMHQVDNYLSASIRIVNQLPRAAFAGRRARRRAYLDYWGKLIAEAAEAGMLRPGIDVSVSRMLLLGMLNSSIEWFRKDGLSATDVARQAADLLLNGLMLPEQGKLRGIRLKESPVEKTPGRRAANRRVRSANSQKGC